MKKLKKLLAGVLTLAMAMSMMTMTAFAANEPTTFDGSTKGSLTIHKKAFDENVTLDKGYATGEELKANQIPAGVKGLNGVEFTIYKVVDAAGLDQYYSSNPTTLPKVDAYLNADGTFKGTALATTKGTTATVDGEAGVIKFDNLDLGLYVVIETKSPDLVTEPVDPFLVSIPMTKTDGSGWLYNVHVYPKNGTNAAGELTLTKKGKVTGDTSGAEPALLKNVIFELQRKEGSVWEPYEAIVDSDGNKTDLTLETDANGKITIENLPDGEYRFIERKIGADMDSDGVNKNAGYIRDGKKTYEFTITKGKYSNPTSSAGVTVLENGKALSIEVMNEKPKFDKEIKDGNNWGDVADYSVGDIIDYQITIGIPSNIADLKVFKVTDKPTNLQIQSGSVSVKVGNASPASSINVGSNGSELTVEFTPSALATYAGQVMTIAYKAKLTDGALTQVSNANHAKLEYSHDVNSYDEPGDPDTETTEDETYAESYKLKITKTFDPGTDQEGNELTSFAGVTFDLYKIVDGEKVLVKSGIATEDDGTVIQGGLSNGTYQLVETKTLPGYNLLKEPVDVELAIEYSSTTKTTTKTEKDSNGNVISTTTNTVTVTRGEEGKDTASGIWGQEIINKKGFTLPTTGGMGTFVFTFVGVAMMAAAVILFITSKKKTVK